MKTILKNKSIQKLNEENMSKSIKLKKPMNSLMQTLQGKLKQDNVKWNNKEERIMSLEVDMIHYKQDLLSLNKSYQQQMNKKIINLNL